MKRIMVLALCFLAFQSIALGGKIPFAEDVPFLGLEKVAAVVKKTVFAVQIEGRQRPWETLGSGFFVKGDPNLLFGVTCAHVVAVTEEANKPIFIGLITNKGYRHIKCEVVNKDPNIDVAV